MKSIQSITVVEDVTLVSLNDSPADIASIAEVFRQISDAGIDVDMISQTPPHSNRPHLSFTVGGEDLGEILEISAQLRAVNPDLKLSVSNGNSKISVFGEAMRNCPGVAAKVFQAVSAVQSDIVMITTSEIDISLLVPSGCLTSTVEAITKAFE